MGEGGLLNTYDENGISAADRIAIAQFKHENAHKRDNTKARLAYLRRAWRLLRANDLVFDIQAEIYAGQPIIPIIAARHVRTLDRMLAILKEVQRIKQPRPKTRTGDITPAMIAQAEAYPIENVLAEAGIEVDRHNKCLCPFHSDTRPSMSIKHNRVLCFACGARDNNIGLKRHLTGQSFPDTVKELCGGVG